MDFAADLLQQDIGIFWYPAIMLVILLFLMLIFYIWGRLYFRKDYNADTDQIKPYNSGNLDEVNYSIKSSNLYWGFRKSMEVYFRNLKALHEGDLNDYVKWFVIFVAVCLLLAGGGLL